MAYTLYRVSFDLNALTPDVTEFLRQRIRRRASITNFRFDAVGPGGGNPRIRFIGGLEDALFVASLYCPDAESVSEFFSANVIRA